MRDPVFFLDQWFRLKREVHAFYPSNKTTYLTDFYITINLTSFGFLLFYCIFPMLPFTLHVNNKQNMNNNIMNMFFLSITSVLLCNNRWFHSKEETFCKQYLTIKYKDN